MFPTFDLSIPVGQLPPSLPFTDPVIPDMHPTPYLFSLHRMSLERANQLLATRLFHLHQTQVARKLYDAEVERIEDEYEAASKSVVDRLLEGVEERRRRLTEEKDGEGTTLGERVSLLQHLSPRGTGLTRLFLSTRVAQNHSWTLNPALTAPVECATVPHACATARTTMGMAQPTHTAAL